MISYLPRCWANCSEVYWHPRSEWNTVSPVVCGRLRAAISIASHNGLGAACCRPNRVPGCFLRTAAQDGRQVHESLPGADTGGCRPPTCSPGWLAAGVPPDQVGARAQVPGRDGGAGSFWRGCAAWRALLTHDGCAPCPGSSQRLCGPRRRGPFGTRRVARELLRTHSIKALSSFLRRAVLDGSRPSQA